MHVIQDKVYKVIRNYLNQNLKENYTDFAIGVYNTL